MKVITPDYRRSLSRRIESRLFLLANHDGMRYSLGGVVDYLVTSDNIFHCLTNPLWVWIGGRIFCLTIIIFQGIAYGELYYQVQHLIV